MTTWAYIEYPKFESSFCNQTTSHTTIVTHLYSTFVFVNGTIGYFLLLQLIALLLRKTWNHLLISYLKHYQPNQHPCIHVLVISSRLHKKFHTTKYVLCTSICASLHPNVVFVVFAWINSPLQLHNSNLTLWWSCKSNSPQGHLHLHLISHFALMELKWVCNMSSHT